jgi:hypothetical protein
MRAIVATRVTKSEISTTIRRDEIAITPTPYPRE